MRAAHKRTRYGRKRLAWSYGGRRAWLFLLILFSIFWEWPGISRPKEEMQDPIPCTRAWEQKRPFTLVQAGVKDIMDKATLEITLWD